MSANVRVLPTLPAVEAAWQAYADIVARERENPELRADRAHIEAAIRAHEHFRVLFLELGKRERGW